MLNVKQPRNQKGFVIPAFAAIAVALIAFSGLVVDIGLIRYWRRQVQNAADMAAIGGVSEMLSGSQNSNYNNAGLQEAAANGMTNGSNGVTVSLYNPPQTGPFAGKNRYVEAVISKQVPLTFFHIFNRTHATVAGRAVAGPRSSDACILALNPDDEDSFEVGGSSLLQSECGIAVNSRHPVAADVDSCIEAPLMYVVGGVDPVPPAKPNNCPGYPMPKTGIHPFPDPFAKLPPPTVPSTCTYTNFKIENGTSNIGPGVYCGGIRVNGGTLNLSPGMYILKGGGLFMNANAVIHGTGVTFYVTYGSTGNLQYGKIQMNGTVDVQLKAPTSGTYEGILFFEDRSVPAEQYTHTLLGDSTSIFEGALYFKKSTIEFTGSNYSSAYTILVADKISIWGNAQLRTYVKQDYTSLQYGSPLRLTGGVSVE